MREFVSTRPTLQEILKGVLQVEMKKKKTLKRNTKVYTSTSLTCKSKYIDKDKIVLLVLIVYSATQISLTQLHSVKLFKDY